MYEFDWTRTVRGVDPAGCFAVVTDAERASEWVSLASSTHGEGPPGVGREIVVQAGIVGVHLTVRATVETWEEPTAYAFAGTTPFPTRMSFAFAPSGDGTTLRCTCSADPRRFFRLGTAGLAARTFARAFEGDLDRLVALVEAEGR